jgi:hypothetical protein
VTHLSIETVLMSGLMNHEAKSTKLVNQAGLRNENSTIFELASDCV